MSVVAENIRELAARLQSGQARRSTKSASQRLAEALYWTKSGARIEQSSVIGVDGLVVRAFVGNQPAAIFVGDHQSQSRDLLSSAALYAYHSSIEWGMVADLRHAIVFNSHWVKNNYWFHLPPISWSESANRIDVFEALTPSGLRQGRIDEIALEYSKPENQLQPVDDALVDRLDHWRDEALRYAKRISDIDYKLQTLFAQLFILRAVEDRKIEPRLPSLWDTLRSTGEIDLIALKELFAGAKGYIQSELFDAVYLDDIPEFVLSGIIKDLFIPEQVPVAGSRYNFTWISADILGRAYEKYLSTILVPSAAVSPQMRFWQQPLREVERVTARKASGVYYTPRS